MAWIRSFEWRRNAATHNNTQSATILSLVYDNNKGCLRRDECCARLFFANDIIYIVLAVNVSLAIIN